MGTAQSAPDLAAIYLKSIDAPASDSNIKALSAWFAIESGWSSYKNGTVNVVGNNPLNITGTGKCGSRSYAGHKFAVFCTPEEGAQRWSSMLQSQWGARYGYIGIYDALRTGDGNRTLSAIIDSGWVTGRRGNQYGHEGSNTLIKVYNSIASKDFTPTGGPIANDPTILAAWGNLVHFPVGHVLTAKDVEDIVKTLRDNKLFNYPGTAIYSTGAEQATKDVLTAHIGETWDKSLQDKLQKELFGKASAVTDNPINNLATSISSPTLWIRVAAGIGGAIFVVFGLQIIAKSAINSADFGGVQEVDVIDEPTRKLGITNEGKPE